MSDNEAIQGLWRIDSMTHGGQMVGHSDTHREFDGNRIKEIIPTYVDGGTWGTFVLDPTTTPKHIDSTFEFTRDGKTYTVITKEVYELNGDTLRIGGALYGGRYAEEISDDICTVTTLTRDNSPRPETKKASGIQPVQSAVFGTVIWNDDLENWDARFNFAPKQKVPVSLIPLQSDPDATIKEAEAFMEWLKTHETDARTYAAKQMTDTAEDWRDPDIVPDEITPESFAARIKLSEISMESTGEATLWYNDDDIFGGHVIMIALDTNRNFTDAQMMG